MTPFRRLLVAAVLLHAAAGAAHAHRPDVAGLRVAAADVPERGEAVEVDLWYPTDAEGTPEPLGAGPVFEGTPALRDAPVAEGAFPVVVLAHGGLRAAPRHADWIAARLAARGYIVAVAHPPPLGERGAQAAVPEVWLRPADLSAALTAVERDPDLAPHVAPGQAATVGFFLGGTSALALAGARLDARSYAASCDQGGTGLDCRWFAKNGVDLRTADPAQVSRPHRDVRIKAAVAVDPELSGHFDPASLAAVGIPVAVVNLGRPGALVPGLDASGLEKAIPGARYETVPDAAPFSAFAPCTPRGAALLREEGEDDALCRDGGDRPRAQIHDQLAATIEAALRRGLPGG